MHWNYYDHGLFCVECEKKNPSIFKACYQLLNKAKMYRSVNILLFCLWFASFLHSRFYHTQKFDSNDI